MPVKVRAMIGGVGAAGAVTLGIAAALALETGVGPLAEFLAMTFLLAVSWAFPVRVLRTEETEAFQLDEAFFVAMALLLTPAGTLLGFAGAIALGFVVRRRPLDRAVFNIGQTVTAAGLALLAMYLIDRGAGTAVTPRAVAAALVGAAVFVLANSFFVSVVISLNEGKSAARVFVEGLDLRILVWAGGTALGLLAAIGAAAHPWALVLGAIPMAALSLILREHAHARRQTQRSQGLLTVANQVHAAVAGGGVEQVVVAATKNLPRCRRARIGTEPPGPGEIGARVREGESERWLVVGTRSAPRASASPSRRSFTSWPGSRPTPSSTPSCSRRSATAPSTTPSPTCSASCSSSTASSTRWPPWPGGTAGWR